MLELRKECNDYYTKEYERAQKTKALLDQGPLGALEVFSLPKPVPPDELRLMWEIEQWGALPWAGGLLDQSAQIMDAVNVCRNAKIEASKIANINEVIQHNANAGQSSPAEL